MLANDQLTRAERIRLEALSQAVSCSNFCGIDLPATHKREDVFDLIIARAEKIEKWLRSAREDA